MGAHPDCTGNCRICTVLGACPTDIIYCADCGGEIEPGEGIEIEVEVVEHRQHGSKMITVCNKCYETLYRDDVYFDEF